MSMKFSQRQGLVPVATTIQVNEMSIELRNSIWNTLDLVLWQRDGFLRVSHGKAGIHDFSHALWFNFFKLPADSRPVHGMEILNYIRSTFFKFEWYEVYDFLEWVVSNDKQLGPTYQGIFNQILESELSGYRFIDGKLASITNEHEIEMLGRVLSDSDFSGAAEHIKRALELFADRKSPDYRNSIKESISAVESVARIVAKSKQATLGDALKVLEKSGKIHPALKEGFLKLYGYTSDEQGIRHAILDSSTVSQAEARFMLMSCTSFVNYLKAQL